jgi:diguanylate cyclase (GGDEF)-like protein
MHGAVRALCEPAMQGRAALASDLATFQEQQTRMVQVINQLRQVLAHAHTRHDVLTGLPLRHGLEQAFELRCKDAQRNHQALCLAMIDLDHFKTVNDTHGHGVGDSLLYQVAQRLNTTLRDSDTLARLGGDEFVVLLPSVTGADQAAKVAEKLLSVLEQPLSLRKHTLHITTSVGICLYPDDGNTAETLLRHADTAMYQAKSAGRNTFRFFKPEMNDEADQRYRIESSLRQAIKAGELRLVFQPLVDMPQQKVFGAEALVRWLSPVHGPMAPAAFIPIAEESDLVVELDSWVLDEACRHAAGWRSRLKQDFLVAVNISARQFRRKGFVEGVVKVLHKHGLPAVCLELEITESSLMDNVSDVMETLNHLVGLGVRLAIDDFGTGYSSLAYLKRFPVHKLKVDQTFVRDIGHTDSDLAIVKTVVALGETLKLDLLAEGVETMQQLVTLRALGCERFQGYLFYKPLESDAIEAALAGPLRLPS